MVDSVISILFLQSSETITFAVSRHTVSDGLGPEPLEGEKWLAEQIH